MDELTAVNFLLDAVGSSPVNSLTSGHPEVDEARTKIDAARKRVQSRGLWFNKDYDVTYTPEAVTKKIDLTGVRSIETFNNELVMRGTWLYNRLKQTYGFDDPVTIPVVIKYIQFNDMPEIAQEVAQYRAASEFVRSSIGDIGKADSLMEESRGLMVELNNEHLRNEKYNKFTTPRIRRARSGIRPYGNARQNRFFGTPDR